MERWTALYTAQKTQKRKVWHDGEVTYNKAKRRLVLRGTAPSPLGSMFCKEAAWCRSVEEGELEDDL